MKRAATIIASLAVGACAVVILMMRMGYPYHRGIAGVVYLAGWGLFLLALRGLAPVIVKNKTLLRRIVFAYFPHVVVAGILIGIGYAWWVLVPFDESDLLSLSDSELSEAIERDTGVERTLMAHVRDVISAFKVSGLLARDINKLTTREREQLRELWAEYVNASMELDLLIDRYRGFYQIDYNTSPALHSDAFFAAFLAFVVRYDASLTFVELLGDNPFMEDFLNEPDKTRGIPANGVFRLKQRTTLPEELLRLTAGATHLAAVKDDMTLEPALIKQLEDLAAGVALKLGKSGEIFLKNPIELLERRGFEAWFPLQKKVAEQMHILRVAERDYFISRDMAASLTNRLQTGDILLQRRNWQMSNMGIPGFWPHVALYLGTLDEMDDTFSEMEFEGSDSFSAYLEKANPRAYAALGSKDMRGSSVRIIEALRPGVVMTSLEDSCNCDYLAALRPRIDKAYLLKAVLAALSHYGKAYDYNFDFATDNTLVCTELIYKSFPLGDELTLAPELVSGRKVMPPNAIAKKFARELGTEQQQLDFVLFLEGSEQTMTAAERDARDFAETASRPKWDLAIVAEDHGLAP